MIDNDKQALEAHKKLRGKIGTEIREEITTREQLGLYYTPGVGAVSTYVAEHPDEAREYTNTNNSVAIVSDGSAVLGLGDIGPLGALPVMEGKAMLFKSFAGIDGVPIVLNTSSVDEIVAAVVAIAPSFGGINLEDIKAPECFEVEQRLKESLTIPVFHDDQHGTAIVTLAGLINACKVTDRTLGDAKVVVSGVGAAGVAIIKLLKSYAPAVSITAVDSSGIIGSSRTGLNETKRGLINDKLIEDSSGDLQSALSGADIFVGVSKGNLFGKDLVGSMAKDSIIFAMSNPNPEIMPDEAKAGGAAVIATGRSDFPNQINNALAFPGIFRGALDNQVKNITEEHKRAAAEAIAALVDNPSRELIIPDIFDERLAPTVSKVIS